MEIKINYETESGIKRLTYYPNFHRNKDLRNALISHFFKPEHASGNLKLIKERFVSFVEELDISKEDSKAFINEFLSETKDLEKLLTVSVVSISNREEYVQFAMNLFYNLTKEYFKSDAVDLGLFLGCNSDPELALIIPKNETKDWVKALRDYQYTELCAPLSYWAYRDKNPYPIQKLVDDFYEGNIKGNVVIRNEFFYYDYDEEEQECLKEDYKMSEMECLMSEIVSSKDGHAYVSINEIKKLNVYENDLVNQLKL